MDETREAEELVGLWQQLQTAQVAGDAGRLEALRRLAEARAKAPGASGEWGLLAREAGRHRQALGQQREAQPDVAIGGASEAPEPVDVVAAPETAREPAEEAERERQGFRLGPLIWVVILVGYLLLQFFGNGGEGP